MKTKTHLRIVCLKNNNEYQVNHQSGFIVSSKPSQEQIKQSSPPPSLVHLSARLQGERKSRENNKIAQIGLELGVNSSNSLASLHLVPINQVNNLPEEPFLTVGKYFQQQKMKRKSKKSAIKNLMGSIDISAKWVKQQKIASSFMKQTINRLSGTQDLIRNKKKQHSLKKYTKVQNKASLEQDFRNFLNNKHEQFEKAKIPTHEEDEKFKIKRLSIVNPERSPDKPNSEEFKQLNLFNFQQNKHNKRTVSQRLPSLPNSSHNTSIIRARLQKKIFEMELNIKAQEQFQWSKFEQNKGFTFQTILL